MAVLPMKKIEICAMKRDRKAILEKLQSLGMVEIQTDNEETDDFRKMSTTSQRAKYEKRAQNTDEALQIIDKYAPEDKSIFASLEGRQEASEADIQGSMGKDEFAKGSKSSATEYGITHTDEVKDPGDQQGHSRL